MTLDGGQLDLIWTTAAGRPIVSAFRTAPIGVDTPHGAVHAGVDALGHRHLLVPIASKHSLQEMVDGDAVVLRRRALEDEQSYRQYASLELVDDRLTDLFTALCVEVAERVAATPDRAVAALRDALKDWRALLAGNRQLLSSSALAGLYGELDTLRSLLLHDPGAVGFWTGPAGSAQDFQCGRHSVEVKTTTAPEGRTIRVHGADQLDVSPPGRLLLRWIRLRADKGTTVPELIADIAARTDDAVRFQALLRQVGYDDADRAFYDRKRFDLLEEQTYEVVPGFPRITPAGLIGDAVLGGVGPVEYGVDLDAAAAEGHRTDIDPAHFLLEEV